MTAKYKQRCRELLQRVRESREREALYPYFRGRHEIAYRVKMLRAVATYRLLASRLEAGEI